MAEVQLRSLRVQAELDASAYVASAAQMEAADKRIVNSNREVAAAVSQMDTKLSQAGDAFEKLKRQFVEGYSATINMGRSLDTVNRGLETGKLSAAQAERAIEGIVRKYGRLADMSQVAAQAQAKGQVQILQAVERANAALQRQGALTAANSNKAYGRERADAMNVAFQLQDVAVTAAMGMSPMTIALQQGTQIAGILGPMGAAGAVEALRSAVVSLLNPVSLLSVGLVGAAAAAVQYLGPLITDGETANEKLKRQLDLIDQVASKWGDALPALKAYNDERKRGEELEQQRQAVSAAIDLTWAGARDTIRDFNIEVQDAITSLTQAGVASDDLIAVQNAWQRLTDRVDAGKASYEDVRAAKTTLALLMNQNLIPTTDRMTEAWERLVKIIDEASGRSRRLAADLNDPLAKYDEMRKKGEEYTKRLLITQKALHDRYNPVNIPEGTRIPIPQPRPSPFPMIDEEPEKKQLSTYEQLAQAQQQRIDNLRHEIQIAGLAVDVQARLRAEYQAEAEYRRQIAAAGGTVNDAEIAKLRELAAEHERLNQALSARRLQQSQQDQIDALRLEADLIGASAEVRARETAIYQANLQLRQAGINLASQEAQAYRNTAAAIAESRLEIERQQAAYNSMQQAGSSAIDALVTGTGSLKDRIRSAGESLTKWLTEIAIANPLKNALLGTNLPTFSDLMAGKPMVPQAGVTSTATMTVTAGTVMINGMPVGMPGGFPGVPGSNMSGGLADLIFGKTDGTSSSPFAAASNVAKVLPAANQNSLASQGDLIAEVMAAKQNPFSSVLANAGTTKTGVPLSEIRAGNLTAYVNSQYAGNFQGFINELQARGYQINSIGGYNYRTIAGSTRLSNHAFGNAIDINPTLNPVTYPGRGQPMISNMPADVSDLAAKWGLSWGGDWRTKKDPMHFEVAKGAKPIQADQFNSALKSMTKTTQEVTPDIASLGTASSDTANTITDTLGKLAQPGQMPQIPLGGMQAGDSGLGGFGLIGGIFKLIGGLFGFADGTDFAPGGLSIVGERGPELVRLPRGSQVIPNHRIDTWKDGKWESGRQEVEVKVRVEMGRDGNLQAYVRDQASAVVNSRVPAYLDTYSRDVLPTHLEKYGRDPWGRGGS